MDNKIIVITALAFWCFGCAAAAIQSGKESCPSASPSVATAVTGPAGGGDLIFDPAAIDRSALPNLHDLPFPAGLKHHEKIRSYTGIIKNKTKYAVVVPSANSDATLAIPAHSWIEYTTWTRKSDITVYRNGKPFYCLKICASPQDFPFMCQKYDFMAEIVKPEAATRRWPSKLKPRKKIKRKVKNPPC